MEPTIKTDRLDLLPLDVRYADEMATVLADPTLHAYTGGAPATPAELRARYERQTAGSPDPAVAWHNWVIRLRDDASLTGYVQATVSDSGTVAEIAWVVGTPWQGRGIAREAATGLVAWLEQTSVRKALAHIHPEHLASQAVAEAVGLVRTDELLDGEICWVREF